MTTQMASGAAESVAEKGMFERIFGFAPAGNVVHEIERSIVLAIITGRAKEVRKAEQDLESIISRYTHVTTATLDTAAALKDRETALTASAMLQQVRLAFNDAVTEANKVKLDVPNDVKGYVGEKK